jgi:hypothetical protein
VFVGGKNEIRSYFFLNRSFVVSVPHINFHKHVNLGISRARFLSINQPRRKIIVLVLSPVRSRQAQIRYQEYLQSPSLFPTFTNISHAITTPLEIPRRVVAHFHSDNFFRVHSPLAGDRVRWNAMKLTICYVFFKENPRPSDLVTTLLSCHSALRRLARPGGDGGSGRSYASCATLSRRGESQPRALPFLCRKRSRR